ncbi:hypothetical protein [Streptomyces xinghaiensis]|uniref:hypothetical protein n=1 Tax=Streptomyces xinghaiensis TaxID=1038928 RepID=UPI0003200243|nr:hypothetical protein [Streptomyces xinghaiensis]MZE79999.1 hypothetical protein [Streptomyces sp. SID5475]
MGWTVLYIAFGVVALWLLGEVLLQYKARLRWRLLAFAGFSCVVVGVLLIPSVVLIGIGAMAFAVGQTFVTLSFRRGFSTGWAIGGKPGASKRRKGDPGNRAEPTLEVSDLEALPDGGEFPDDGAFPDDGGRPEREPEPAVYRPEPLPDDTGEYGVYGDTRYGDPGRDTGRGGYGEYAGYDDGYGTYVGTGAATGQAGGQTGYGQGQGTYDYQTAQYGGYADPYSGAGDQGYGQGYAPDGGAYGAADPYAGAPYQAADPYAADPYAQPYSETPPGGVWVPQQRDGAGPLPPEEAPADQTPYPYQAPPGYNSGFDEQQYRY